MEYQVVTAKSLIDRDELGIINHANTFATPGLNTLVNQLLEEGWQPVGGVSRDEGIWMQAMVKGGCCCPDPDPEPTPNPDADRR